MTPKSLKQVHTIIRCIRQGLQGKSADHFGSLGSFANRGRVMYMQKLIELMSECIISRSIMFCPRVSMKGILQCSPFLFTLDGSHLC